MPIQNASRLGLIGLLACCLLACFHPPYNHFQGNGATITRSVFGYQSHSKRAILQELQDQDIEFVQYGDVMTLLVPVDRYFLFNSAHLNDICYPGLMNIVRLIKLYNCSPVYVAAFTDHVGSRHHKKKLSQAQAETMLTFLWANGIAAQRLHAEGYADKYPIGDNQFIHSSAYNRRIEIQWVTPASIAPRPVTHLKAVK